MTASVLFAVLGAKALWLLYIWLLSAIISAELSRSKGYGEKVGLGTGLLTTIIGPIIWLAIPPKDELAEWHHRKPWQRRHRVVESEMAEMRGPTMSEAMDEATMDATSTSGTDAAEGADSGPGSRPGETRT
jgi:hypothetical protein